MLWHALELLDALMVFGLMYCLRCCWRCRLLWAIQALQLIEVGDYMAHHYAFARAWDWEPINLIVDGVAAFASLKHFKAASWLMGAYFYLKWLHLESVDVPWQVTHDLLFWVMTYLNELLLLTLLAYPVRKVILHLWRTYIEPVRS